MPVYQLGENIIFPNPENAGNDGLLAFGGDLSENRLLEAYKSGIFPWYSEGQPILWWSPNPRMVLFPVDFKRYKSLKQVVSSQKFDITFDSSFKEVITSCAVIPRTGQDGETWITNEMIEAYLHLHKKGFAHSVEVQLKGKLVGGLYGISLGKAFFGESMFHIERDASKVALWYLVDLLIKWNYDFIDVQQDTDHLRSLGAISILRKEFLNLLSSSVKKEGKNGNWSEIINNTVSTK